MLFTQRDVIGLIVTAIVSFILGLAVDLVRKYLANKATTNIAGTWNSSYRFSQTGGWTNEIATIERHWTCWRIVSKTGKYKANITAIEGHYLVGTWVSTDPAMIVKKPGTFILYASEEYIYGVASDRDSNDNEILIPWCFSLISHDTSTDLSSEAVFADKLMLQGRRMLKRYLSPLVED